MNARLEPDTRAASDVTRFRAIRGAMPALAEGLSPEDLAAQSMPDCSPGKWHLAHTSWFFEAMILSADPDYAPVDPRFQQLFNSYYEALGERVPRPQRGLMTRPSVNEVLAYRREIDRRMAAWLASGPSSGHQRYLFELGLHHDQQHQELFLMDLLNLMACSPLDPAAYAVEPRQAPHEAARGGAVVFEGGLVSIGHGGAGFAFDNEGPSHRVWLEPFALAADLVTNGDWLGFIADGGYARPELWLSDGWATVKAEAWTAPLYWRRDGDDWTVLSLIGRAPVDPTAPVRHVSFYEADAYARWAGKRLPSEAEWEHAATTAPDAFSNLSGEVWQWTSSAYAPYPGFQPTPGTAAEYNGKFMANQMVLRGGAFATPPGHARVTYRNFFYPQQRWAFMGLRLAEDAPRGRTSFIEDAQTAAFRRDLVQGLSRDQKAVPPKWFYDAEGSRLFEEITALPEYYPTRQETALLRDRAAALTADFGPEAVLVEFGSGASEKTRILLDAAPDLGAYVPLDPGFPAERLGHMLADSGARLLLTQGALLDGLPAAPAGTAVWCLDREPEGEDPDAGPEELPVREDWPAALSPEHLAYVIYTSGSTGRPKGVAVRHGGLANFLASVERRPGLAAGSRVLGLTSLSFDIAALELYLPLVVGGTVVLADAAAARDPARLWAVIRDGAVDVVQATPSSWRMLGEAGGFAALSGRVALCGGEALPAELAGRLAASASALWNLYGPTETTIWSAAAHLTTRHLSAEGARPHLGEPLARTTLHLLDGWLEPVPAGVVGELWIGGEGLARGRVIRRLQRGFVGWIGFREHILDLVGPAAVMLDDFISDRDHRSSPDCGRATRRSRRGFPQSP